MYTFIVQGNKQIVAGGADGHDQLLWKLAEYQRSTFKSSDHATLWRDWDVVFEGTVSALEDAVINKDLMGQAI